METEKKLHSSEWHILRYYAGISWQYRRTLLLSIFYVVGTFLLGTLVPFYVGKLLAALSTDPQSATHYLPYVFGIGIVGALSNRIGSVQLFEHIARVIADLQTRCLEVLLKQSTGFHNNRVAGKLVSDAIDFPIAYNMLAGALLVDVLPLLVTILVGVILVAAKSLVLGLVLLGMASIAIGMALWQSKTRKPLRVRRLAATKAVTSHLADTIVNNQTVKTFAQEGRELAYHGKLNKHLSDIRVSDWRSGAGAGNNRILGLLCFQFLFAILVIHVVQRDPSLLAIGIFAFSYSVVLSNSLFRISSLIKTVEDGFLQAEPMMDILEQETEITDKPGSTELKVSKGEIEFRNVHFSYQESSSTERVFQDLTLHVKHGEKIGLVGPSGGGKSTFTRLLLRFNDIQDGEITIDGQNIADVTQASLREAIAYVPQEPLMFHRSVFENIAYGNATATKEMVIDAARKANAHDFISNLPDGYDTLVGERGVKLSGGQRQRVAIARAILKDAPILVLDEATSALDSESEALIQDALRKLMKGKTALVIAHRLSTIQKMDRIVVLDNGAIVEQGGHKELVANNKLYAKLWAHQSGGFIED